MYEYFQIDPKLQALSQEAERELAPQFERV